MNIPGDSRQSEPVLVNLLMNAATCTHPDLFQQAPAGIDRRQVTVECAAGSPDRRGSAPMRVLVVDDHHDSRDMLRLLLESWGHTVYAAADGVAALSLAAEHRPQLVLLDIGLPGLDGYEVARQLRHRPETAGVVLAALTGYGRPADRQRSAAAGFSHHLVKPVSADGLRELIASVGS